MHFQYITKGQSYDSLAQHPLIKQGQQLRADGQLFLSEKNFVKAHVSLWWNETPNYAQEKVGVIGHFTAESGQQAIPLLQRACEVLKEHGCTLAVGPMDKNTWYSYRLTTWSDETVPRFYLEPDQPATHNTYFADAGFAPLEHYVSLLDSDLSFDDPRYARVKERFANRGINIRPVDKHRFETELDAIYRISVASFQGNPFYTPISREAFMAMYAPLKDVVVEPLILIAEHEGKAVGFVFCLPNYAERKTQTLIIKTIAVLPGRTYAGLGAALTGAVRANARELGFTQAIYALIHKNNVSLSLGNKYQVKTIREYALFAKELR